MFSKYFRSKKAKDGEVSLVAEGGAEKASVLKSELIRHSPVFRKMAKAGELKGSRQVQLRGVSAIGLRKIAEYIGSGFVHFQDHLEAIGTLSASHRYQVSALTDACCDFLLTVMDSGNVCEIFECVSALDLPTLEYRCLAFVDQHAEEVLVSASFLRLGRPTAMDIVRRQSLRVSSEMVVFRAVLSWAKEDILRRGLGEANVHLLTRSATPLLAQVRFSVLSEEELSDPDVDRLLSSVSGRSSSRARSVSGTFERTARRHVPEYEHEVEALGWDEHAVRSGESFRLRIEVLQGRLFLTGVSLAFERFAGSKDTCCLSAAVSATHARTGEQRCARGTFLTPGEEPTLRFATPLVARELERVDVAVQVKRSVNACAAVVGSDGQIVLSEGRGVAMKITSSGQRSLFRSVKYFH